MNVTVEPSPEISGAHASDAMSVVVDSTRSRTYTLVSHVGREVAVNTTNRPSSETCQSPTVTPSAGGGIT